MSADGIALRCPRCGADLERGDRRRTPALLCAGCGHRYPVVAGIPDLRLSPDPYIGFDEDRVKARLLAERLDDFDLAGLIDFYYRSTPAVPAHHARLYARGLLAAETRAEMFLDRLTGAVREGGDGGAPSAAPGSDFLDLGCGTAPLAVAAARRGHRVLGVDIALRWLVVARKRLDERGVAAPLVCAGAGALPFASETFARVGAESVLDQVDDQAAALAECRRVLVRGGRLLLSTPNRHSLGPDPQTGIWAGSWLPERTVAAIVRRQGGIPPRRRLLTRRELRRLVAAAGFARCRLVEPRIAAAQRRLLPAPLAAAAAVYGAAVAVPGLGALIGAVGPLLLATAEREETAATEESQAATASPAGGERT